VSLHEARERKRTSLSLSSSSFVLAAGACRTIGLESVGPRCQMLAERSPGDVDRAAIFDVTSQQFPPRIATRFPSAASWLLPSRCSSVGRAL
jgi:hypothetical protein